MGCSLCSLGKKADPRRFGRGRGESWVKESGSSVLIKRSIWPRITSRDMCGPPHLSLYMDQRFILHKRYALSGISETCIIRISTFTIEDIGEFLSWLNYTRWGDCKGNMPLLPVLPPLLSRFVAHPIASPSLKTAHTRSKICACKIMKNTLLK